MNMKIAALLLLGLTAGCAKLSYYPANWQDLSDEQLAVIDKDYHECHVYGTDQSWDPIVATSFIHDCMKEKGYGPKPHGPGKASVGEQVKR